MRHLLAPSLVLAMVVAACDSPQAALTEVEDSPTFSASVVGGGENIVDIANALLEAQSSEFRVAYAEYYTDPGSGQTGNIIFARDVGNKQLGLDFIPDDPRRGGIDGDPNTIDFLIDQIDGNTGNGLTEATTTAAITRAMGTWDAQVCSDLSAGVFPFPVDLGLVQFLLGFGGGAVATDVMHAGWVPGAFFDAITPGGSGSILAITFTLVFTTGDLDGDGRRDLALREIYYNNAFPWADNGVSHIDVETVALHEAGHGLSQGHFGTIFFNPNSGNFQFAPRASMNAAYSGIQRSPSGTDDGGHCSLWANWPNN